MSVIAISEIDLVETYCKHCKNIMKVDDNGLFGCTRFANIDILHEIDKMKRGSYKTRITCKYFERKD